MRILFGLWMASILPGVVMHAAVNRAAIGCMADALDSGFPAAALTGRAIDRPGGCAAARGLQGTSEKTVRLAAIGDLVAGNYQRARDRLMQGAPAANEAVLHHYFLGLAMHALGDSKAAIREWGSIDHHGRGLLAIAERLVLLGRPDAAVPYCRAAAETRPDSVDVRFRLAETLNLAGQVDEARVEYRRGFASGSLPTSIDVGQVAFHYAQILAGRREFDEAIAVMEKAIAARPHYPNYMGFLAQIYTQSGDPDRAVIWLDEAVTAAPDSGYPYWEYGRFYLSRQMPSPAIEHLERAVRLDPDPAYYYADLGRAYFAGNRVPQAIEAWREATRRAPGNATYRQWLASAEAAVRREK